MGINELWSVLADAADTSRTLPEIAVADGFNQDTRDGVLNIGIDASICLQKISVLSGSRHLRYRRKPEVLLLLKYLAGLTGTTGRVFFVWDGPNRPSTKRGKKVTVHDHWFVEEFRTLVNEFGFFNIDAPGEAEAQLAHMQQLGLLHVILTEDSDTVVFGGTAIVLNSSYKGNDDKVKLFKAPFVLKHGHKEHELLRADFVLVALLAGNDYDTAGIVGCGAMTASRVALYGFGRTLCNAFESMDDIDFEVFLVEWRRDLRTALRLDPLEYIGSKHPQLANRVRNTFPDLDVLQKLFRPTITVLSPLCRLPPPLYPNVIKITRFIEKQRLYDDTHALLKMFRKLLWPGLVLRELMELAWHRKNTAPIEPSGLFTIRVLQVDGNIVKLRVTCGSVDNIVVHSLTRTGDGERNGSTDVAQGLARSRYVHVPLGVFEQAYGELTGA